MQSITQSFTPQVFLPAVWPLSLSLATTHEISVDFFSSSYLDVSVRKVPSPPLCIHDGVTRHDSCGVSPFGHLRIKAYLLLPEAYRSLSRPSSAPNAKAFSLCSSSLELLCLFPDFVSYMSFANRFFRSIVIFYLRSLEKPVHAYAFLDSSVFSICLLVFLYSVFKVLSRSLPSPWWAQMDSNHRPRAYQARALTS